MKLQLALEIVLDLADDSILSEQTAMAYGLEEERTLQLEAHSVVKNILTIISKHD